MEVKAVETIGNEIYDFLSAMFPVSCASDEFYFFPQIPVNTNNDISWDSFDSESINEVTRKLKDWYRQLENINVTHLLNDNHIDIELLKHVISTLWFQLSEIRSWERQPTLYLTIAAMGLSEAIQSGNPEFIYKRVSGLSAFLDQARKNLERVPTLFRDMGMEMLWDFREFLLNLENNIPEIRSTFPAIERFEEGLKTIQTDNEFRIPDERLKHILIYHTSGMEDVSEITNLLEREIGDMHNILENEGKSLAKKYLHHSYSGISWENVLHLIPYPDPEKIDMMVLYSEEIERLMQHCIDNKWISSDLISDCPVHVEPIPSYLSAIRTTSSYSISPGHPPMKGTFYVDYPAASEKKRSTDYREYRMLTAHETYPGHHLLDNKRWSSKNSIRRPIEHPVFYEGWACFAEELMRLSGYFSTPEERFLLAKRRLWRAVRGKVDLGLQTGTMNIEKAAKYLQQTGISRERAISIVQKYLLNPGYQLCYTIGIGRFLDLYRRYGSDNLNNFINTALTEGEIGFIDLEKKYKLATE